MARGDGPADDDLTYDIDEPEEPSPREMGRMAPPTASPSSAAAPPTRPIMTDPVAPTTKWPTILGVVSIVFAAFALLSGVWQLVASRLMGSLAPHPPEVLAVFEKWSTLSDISSGLMIVVAGIAIAGGVGLVRRRQSGPKWIQIWALAKIPLVVFNGLIGWQLQMDMLDAQTMAMQLPAGAVGGFQGAIMAVGMFIGAVWGWALPVFVLVWFRRATIQAEVRDWA